MTKVTWSPLLVGLSRVLYNEAIHVFFFLFLQPFFRLADILKNN